MKGLFKSQFGFIFKIKNKIAHLFALKLEDKDSCNCSLFLSGWMIANQTHCILVIFKIILKHVAYLKY